MPAGPNQLAGGSAPRSQQITAFQSGNNVDATLFPAGAVPVRGKGRIVRAFACNLSTQLTVDATFDVVPKRFVPRNGVARGATTLIPIVAPTALRLKSVAQGGPVVGVPIAVVPVETEVVENLQAPGGANQVKLAAADAQPDGFYADADIEIIAGTGKGQKNRLTSYANATKIATVLNIEGTPNWKLATDATSIARIRTRQTVVDKDDQFVFANDFTVAGGAAGTDNLSGIEIEFDDNVNV